MLDLRSLGRVGLGPTHRWLFVFTVCWLGLFGCGSRDDGAVRLELWTLALRPTFTEYMQGVCAAFEAEHPGVEVVWVDVPFDAIDRKLVAAASAGRAPDVVNLSDRGMSRYVALGALAPLDGTLPGDAESAYLGGALRSLRIGDEQLALPWYLTTPVRLANEAELQRGGLAGEGLADTWSGLGAQARAYHAASGGRFLFTVSLGESSELPVMLLAEGLPPFKQDGDRLTADLTRDEVVAFVAEWVELYRDGVLPRAAATRGHEHLVEAYQNGSVALVQTGPNMLKRVRDANPRVYGQTTVLPPLTGALGRSHIAVMCVGVMRSSEHPELAAALAWHVTNAANQEALASMVPVLPSTRGSMARLAGGSLSAVSDGGERLVAARDTAAEALTTAVAFTPTIEAWPDLRRAFDEGIKAALLEGADVRETLADIEVRWDRLLAARRAATLDAVPRPEAAR
ncbi:MAG: extracellular solute-binding protein [Planctomycetota bacterium]